MIPYVAKLDAIRALLEAMGFDPEHVTTAVRVLGRADANTPAAERLQSQAEPGSPAVSGEAAPVERWMSPRELSQYFGVHQTTIGRWHLPSHGKPYHRRFLLSEVSAFMKSGEFTHRVAVLKSKRRTPGDRATTRGVQPASNTPAASRSPATVLAATKS